MTQASLLSQAKQGDAQAIESLMNQALRPAGIQVRLLVFQSCLTVMAIAKTVPDRKFMVNFVQRGMGSLSSANGLDIQQVLVQGFLQGNRTPQWQVTLVENGGKFVLSPEETAPQPAPPTPFQNPPELNETASLQGDRPLQEPPVSNSASRSIPKPALDAPALDASGPRPKASPISSKLRQPQAAPATYRKPLSPAQRWVMGIGGWILAGVIALGLRVIIALLAETQVYTLPYAGELLQSMEVAELLNLIIFAVLGLGMGLSAIILPRRWGVQLSAVVLTLLVPAVFMVSPAVRHQLWLRQVSDAQQLTPAAVLEKTDQFLESRVEETGLLGFYVYTAKYSKLPIAAEDTNSVSALDKQVNLTLADAARVPETEVAKFLEWGTWGIRGFYFLVATFAAVSHFRQGISLRDL
ncbi:MAG: hypothetical protein AAF685_13645 [Cyanobacteria bacterium P01_C01_bin.89]